MKDDDAGPCRDGIRHRWGKVQPLHGRSWLHSVQPCVDCVRVRVLHFLRIEGYYDADDPDFKELLKRPAQQPSVQTLKDRA